jgi:hypothetical protein
VADQETKILSPENVPMFTAVAFIIALIALAFSLLSYRIVRQATVGLAVLQVAKAKGDHKKELGQNTRIDALEKRLVVVETRAQKMEQAVVAAPPAPTAAAPPKKK